MKLYMKQKALALVDRYKIYDDNQTLKYYTKGNFFSIRGVMKLYNQQDELLYTFKHKLVTFLPRVVVINEKTHQTSVIKKRLTWFKPKLTIRTAHHDYTIHGSFWQYHFNILKDNQEVATIRKKILSWADAYEIDSQEQQIEEILSLVIGIDTIIHNDRYNT